MLHKQLGLYELQRTLCSEKDDLHRVRRNMLLTRWCRQPRRLHADVGLLWGALTAMRAATMGFSCVMALLSRSGMHTFSDADRLLFLSASCALQITI